MPKITDERREEQRRRIVDAGVEILKRKGMAGFSMGDVIAESGLSSGAIYGYFAGKDEIVIAVGRAILGERGRQLTAISERRPVPPPSAALGEFLRGLPAELVTSGAVLQVWSEAGRRPELREHAAVVMDELAAAMSGYLAAWLRHGRGLPEDDAERRARRATPAVLGLVQGCVAQATLRGRLDVEAYLDSTGAAVDALAEAGAEPGADASRGPNESTRHAARTIRTMAVSAARAAVRADRPRSREGGIPPV